MKKLLLPIIIILFACVSPNVLQVEVDRLDSEIQALKYGKAIAKYVSAQIDSVYEAIELNSFLIEALFGELEMLKEYHIGDEIFYLVKKGDTLWWIAERYLENPLKWVIIYEWNKDIIKNPNLIYPNQELKLNSTYR